MSIAVPEAGQQADHNVLIFPFSAAVSRAALDSRDVRPAHDGIGSVVERLQKRVDAIFSAGCGRRTDHDFNNAALGLNRYIAFDEGNDIAAPCARGLPEHRREWVPGAHHTLARSPVQR
jgi:hypothetical protein